LVDLLGDGLGELDGNRQLTLDDPEPTETTQWPARERSQSAALPIRVKVLGPAEVEAWGKPVSTGLRASAYELLAWYALHPDGATAEAAIDALWPDVSAKRGRERFWTALGNLRSRLKGPDQDGIEIITKVGGHYRADPSVLDVDLWHFESALAKAARAGAPAEAVGALEAASATFRGDFYPNGDSLWVEPVREDLHRRALDAHIRLAQLHADADRVDVAIAVLERTIELDLICEDAYRKLISLQIGLGRDDAAQRTWRLLLGRLAELDLEPEDATAALMRDVLAAR
jgi:DNA-binding SARP family transcriptional activator